MYLQHGTRICPKLYWLVVKVIEELVWRKTLVQDPAVLDVRWQLKVDEKLHHHRVGGPQVTVWGVKRCSVRLLRLAARGRELWYRPWRAAGGGGVARATGTRLRGAPFRPLGPPANTPTLSPLLIKILYPLFLVNSQLYPIEIKFILPRDNTTGPILWREHYNAPLGCPAAPKYLYR